MPINDHLAHAPQHGMIVRSRIVLAPGTTLFKLGHRFDKQVTQEDLLVLSKPWWFSEGTAELICVTASRSGESLSEACRRFGAVAKRWGGSADLIVKARVREPLVAYVGPGTIQDFRASPHEVHDNAWDMPLWVPSPSIPQLHIPLAGKNVLETTIAETALADVYIVPIDEWDQTFIRKAPHDKWKYR